MIVYILLGLSLFLHVLTLPILIYFGVFLVNWRKQSEGFFRDLLGVLADQQPVISLPVETKKTWDEKYEDELKEKAERMRRASGLQDLPERIEVNWGTPPPPPMLPNTPGFIIKDKE